MSKNGKDVQDGMAIASPANNCYTETEFEHIVKFSTTYDIGGVRCWMILKGKRGAVQFGFSTGIYLPHVLEEWKHKDYTPEPKGLNVGCHSPKPMYEGQTTMECDLLPNGKCYYDESSLRAKKWFKIFIEKGGDEIWKLLKQEYRKRFSV